MRRDTTLLKFFKYFGVVAVGTVFKALLAQMWINAARYVDNDKQRLVLF